VVFGIDACTWHLPLPVPLYGLAEKNDPADAPSCRNEHECKDDVAGPYHGARTLAEEAPILEEDGHFHQVNGKVINYTLSINELVAA
jgi:hypothetical protein